MSSKRKSTGFEVIIQDLSQHPTCPHGPTLLFSRAGQRFYACSACRNKRDCSFFLRENEWHLKNEFSENSEESPALINKWHDFIKVKSASQSDRAFCHECNVLFKLSEAKERHRGHDLITDLPVDLMTQPSQLLKSLQDNKKEAQYLFDQKTIDTIVKILQQNNLKNIICLGVPRIHEHIKRKLRKSMTSILLDIDKRHHIFYKPGSFCHYNIFNNYFFNGKVGKELFEKFLQIDSGENMCILMDPPFGGRIEPLAETLKLITKKHSHVNGGQDDNLQLMNTILVLPYFMEPYIDNHVGELKMSDYQVSYMNHTSFHDKKAHQASPVRMFTNIPLKNCQLPEKEGYKYCGMCEKWVGEWNNHCKECQSCTSKNGKPYVHCDICQRCVKAKWRHCFKCERCCLEEHECNFVLHSQRCFNCKMLDHKKSDCPKLKGKLTETIKSPKRKFEDVKNTPKIKESQTVLTAKRQRKNKKKERRIRIRKNLEQYKVKN